MSMRGEVKGNKSQKAILSRRGGQERPNPEGKVEEVSRMELVLEPSPPVASSERKEGNVLKEKREMFTGRRTLTLPCLTWSRGLPQIPHLSYT